MKDKVAVVILNYHSPRDVLTLLELILLNKTTFERGDIIPIVVNNSPSDDTKKLLKGFLRQHDLEEGDDLFYIESPKNVGYAKGNNLGISLALELGANYVEIINPDVRVPPNYISEKVKFSKKYGCNITGSILINQEPVSKRYPLGVIKPAKKFDIGVLPERRYVSGAVFMWNKEALDLLGGFNESTFLYLEEQITIDTLKKYGGNVCLAPIYAYHHGGKSIGKLSRKYLFYSMESTPIYLALTDHPAELLASVVWYPIVKIPTRAAGVAIYKKDPKVFFESYITMINGFFSGVKKAIKILSKKRLCPLFGFPAASKKDPSCKVPYNFTH